MRCFFFLLLSPIKIEMYFYMPNTQRRNVQWQHGVWGTGEIFVPANKCTRVIFCSCKIRYLGQGVRSFLVGLSGETCFVLRLQSEINENLLTFPPRRERERGGTVSYAVQNAWCLQRQEEKGKKCGGETLIKQFQLIIIQFSFLFLFSVEKPACHFRWEWLDIAALSTEAYCCMFCHYSMSLFYDIP